MLKAERQYEKFYKNQAVDLYFCIQRVPETVDRIVVGLKKFTGLTVFEPFKLS